MHWFFYIIAAAVTALAIYVQIKRVEKGTRDMEETPEAGSTPGKAVNRKKKRNKNR